jgi:hypothetical protein
MEPSEQQDESVIDFTSSGEQVEDPFEDPFLVGSDFFNDLEDADSSAGDHHESLAESSAQRVLTANSSAGGSSASPSAEFILTAGVSSADDQEDQPIAETVTTRTRPLISRVATSFGVQHFHSDSSSGVQVDVPGLWTNPGITEDPWANPNLSGFNLDFATPSATSRAGQSIPSFNFTSAEPTADTPCAGRATRRISPMSSNPAPTSVTVGGVSIKIGSRQSVASGSIIRVLHSKED